MNSANENYEFNEELLSGYLDGELSGEEQSLVEELLRSDSHAQQLLDDLQQLRHCLQQLPPQQPSSKLRERVSQRISVDATVQLASTNDDIVSSRSVTPWLVATAAGLALLVALPLVLNQQATQVADQDPADPAAAAAADPAADERADLNTGELSASMHGDAESDDIFDPDIPLVYINVALSDIPLVPAILASNGVIVDSQYTAPALELAAAGFAGDGGGAAAAPTANNDAPGEKIADRDKQHMEDAIFSVLVVEASPEQLARAWEQLSKTKSTIIAQQTGTRLPGLSYAPEETKLDNARRVMTQNRQQNLLDAQRQKLFRQQVLANDPFTQPAGTPGEARQVVEDLSKQAQSAAGASGGGVGKTAPADSVRAQAQRKANSVRVRLIIQVSP